MNLQEKGKLAMQIGRLYGSNRHAIEPVHLYLTGLNKSGSLYEECVKKNDGFQNYLVSYIAPDKWGIHIIFFFLFLHENICCRYSLEAT